MGGGLFSLVPVLCAYYVAVGDMLSGFEAPRCRCW